MCVSSRRNAKLRSPSEAEYCAPAGPPGNIYPKGRITVCTSLIRLALVSFSEGDLDRGVDLADHSFPVDAFRHLPRNDIFRSVLILAHDRHWAGHSPEPVGR